MIESVGGAPVWIHIDTDVVDSLYLPAEYKIEQGLRPSVLHALLKDIVGTSEIIGFELTEFEAAKNRKHCARAIRTFVRMIAPVLAAASQARSR